MRVNARLQLFPCCIVWTPLPLIGWFFPFVGHVGICRSDGTILDFAAAYFVNVGEFAFGAPSRYVQFDPLTRALATNTAADPLPSSSSSHHHASSKLHATGRSNAGDVERDGDRDSDGDSAGLMVDHHEGSTSTLTHPDTHSSSTSPSSLWDASLSSSIRCFQQEPYNLFTSNCHSFVSSSANRLALLSFSSWTVIDVALLVVLHGTWTGWQALAYTFAPFILAFSLGCWLAGRAFVLAWAGTASLFIAWFAVGSYVFPSLVKSR